MPVNRELNVFSGEDALRSFYDPDAQVPVPVRHVQLYILTIIAHIILHFTARRAT